MATPSQKALCVINPIAGRTSNLRAEQDCIAGLLAPMYQVDFHITSEGGDAQGVVRDTGKDTRLIVCCGGDGTLAEVAAGLYESGRDIPVCYIPKGTTNDLAKTLKISKKTRKAAGLALARKPVAQDLGSINGHVFTYIAAFGAFTEIAYNTPQKLKNRWGYLAYLSQAVKSLRYIRPHHVKINADGHSMEGDYIFGSMSNSFAVGGIFRLGRENVRLDDGKLELLLVEKSRNAFDFLHTVGMLMAGKHNKPGVHLMHCRRVEAVFETPADWTTDGEYAGEPASVTIDVLSDGLRIYPGDTTLHGNDT